MDFLKLNQKCKEKGITEVEIYNVKSESSSVSTKDGEVDSNEYSVTNDLYIRGVYNNHITSIKCERDCDCEIDNIVNKIVEQASVIAINEPYFIYGGDKEYATLPEQENDFDKYDQQARIQMCLKLEKFCKEKSKNVTKTEAAIDVTTRTVTIQNSNGLDVKKGGTKALFMVAPVVEVDGLQRQGHYFDYINSFDEIDYDKIYEKAIKRTEAMMGAKSMPSKHVPVVFENSMFASLLGCFMSMFSAEAAIKKMSLLEGKVGQKLFGDNVTIYDDPLLEQSPDKTTFDDEGKAAFKKTVVEKGVFKTFLHNLSTAKTFNVESTGNGFKGGDGSISIAPTNFVVEGGNKSFDEMIMPIKDGVFITSMMGQHAGVNVASGAFNLQSSGFLIENGKITRPVTLIVVSGNIIDVLNNIVEISNDFECSRKIACGSVYVKSLAISGNE